MFDFFGQENEPTEIPECAFWNSTKNKYSTEGCIVLRHSSNETTCACTHLTVFQLKKEYFVPDVHLITEEHKKYTSPACLWHFNVFFCISAFTWSNIKSHPTVFLVMGLMTLITITFLIYSPDVDENRPILAQERVFFDK